MYIGGRKPGCKGGMEVKPATHSDASSLAPFLLPFPSPPVQTTKTAILKRKILRTRVGAGLDGKGGGGAGGGEGGRVFEGRAASGAQARGRGIESDPLLFFGPMIPFSPAELQRLRQEYIKSVQRAQKAFKAVRVEALPCLPECMWQPFPPFLLSSFPLSP